MEEEVVRSSLRKRRQQRRTAAKRLRSVRQRAPASADSAEGTRTTQSTSNDSESVKVVKTGMLLSRARVFDPASGVVAARERRTALIGKGTRSEIAKWWAARRPLVLWPLKTCREAHSKHAQSGAEFNAKKISSKNTKAACQCCQCQHNEHKSCRWICGAPHMLRCDFGLENRERDKTHCTKTTMNMRFNIAIVPRCHFTLHTTTYFAPPGLRLTGS